jgi:AcrR family transcriptional regulator
LKVDTEVLLDAAQRVFSESGMGGASIRAIASAAGCDPALIYYHFESKEAMFLALLDRKLPPVARELEVLADPANDEPTSLRLWRATRVYCRHFGEDSGFRAVLRGQILNGTEGTKDAIARHIQRAAKCNWAIVEQGIERGHLRPDLHIRMTGFFLVRMFMEIFDLVPAISERIANVPADQALVLAERAWFELFWRGVAADPSKPLAPDLFSLE